MKIRCLGHRAFGVVMLVMAFAAAGNAGPNPYWSIATDLKIPVGTTCGLLTIDPQTQQLKFTDYNQPGAQPQLISIFWSTLQSGKLDFVPNNTLNFIRNLFYSTDPKTNLASVDSKRAKTGALVQIETLAGPKTVAAEDRTEKDKSQLLQPSQLVALQLIRVGTIDPKNCQRSQSQ